MSNITFTVQENCGFILLNRPQVFNSFNRAMALEMQAVLDECQARDDIRAIAISGEGRAFCAGQDLQEIVAPDGPELSTILQEHYNPIIARIRLLEKPVIAAVNGVAAGAGANIALACDIVIASQSASFIQAFSKIGLIPDSGGTFFLPRLVGFQRAAAMMMLGEKVTADDAEKMGMIYKSVPDENFWNVVNDTAFHLAKMPTKALWLTKKALNESMNNSLETQLALEDVLQTTAGETTDYKEGVAAFLEKRKPIFVGK
jgi:2-(1,2-epoxy-1,2-dihydrophenyl)acetyl-CoA isomerase